MKKIIYNTSEYYEKTDEYYALIAKKLLLEKQICRLGRQLDIPKEKSDAVCNNCGYVTNRNLELYERGDLYKDEPEEPVVCWGYQLS